MEAGGSFRSDAHTSRTKATDPADHTDSSPSTPQGRSQIIICHPEPLIGSAISAVLERYCHAAVTDVVISPSGLLSKLSSRHDLALVSDTVGAELPELFEALAHRRRLSVPVLVMSTMVDVEFAAQIIEWGGAGSVHPTRSIEALRQSASDAASGRLVFLDGHRREILEAVRRRHTEQRNARTLLETLSERERSVLRALASGATPADIARDLSLSPHTVRTHIRTAGAKLGARGQLRIAAQARELFATAARPSRSGELPTIVTSEVVPGARHVV